MFEFSGEFEYSDPYELNFDEKVLGKISEKPGGNFELICGNHLIKGKKLFD